jgi:RNA polymerase sigma factor (sigma-70 family)
LSLVALPAPGASEAGDEVAAGVDGGFEDLYRRYAARVEALAWRRLHDRHAAEDAVQETFLRAYRSFGRIDADRPVWPWLRTIATNVCVDMLRLRRHPDRDGSLSDGDADLGPALPAKSDPGEVHLAAQRRRSIATALAAVNPRQRRVVILRDVEGWENEEVAQLEGITLDAVKSALKRGRQTFRSTYLALADRNGLLGGMLVGAGGLLSRFRRLALRLRASGEASTGAGAVTMPMAQLLPLAIVATLAGGVVAAQDQAQQDPVRRIEAQAIPSSVVSMRDVASDTVVSRDASAAAAAPAVPPDATGAPGTNARVISPLGDREDVDVESALHRDEQRTLVVTKVVVDDESGERVVDHWVSMDCGTRITAAVCDAIEGTWSSAPENP